MLRSNDFIRKNRIPLLFGVVIVLMLLGCIMLLSKDTYSNKLYEGGQYPFQLRIESSKKQYKKSEFIELSLKSKNTGDFYISAPWNRCNERIDVQIDWQWSVFGSPYGLTCSIGLDRMNPGEERSNNKIYLDFSYLESGGGIR